MSEGLALSQGERALWYLHLLAPESSAYHIAAAARVVSELEPEALRRALAGLAIRHPALRTTFEMYEGEPRRRIAPEPETDFATVAATGWTAPELERALADEAHRPFDLERGPLLRMRLFQGAPGGDALLLVLHHIVADFWSLTVLVRDLGRLLTEGAEPLEPLAATYEEHVRAERERLERDGERLREEWRQRLAGAPAALDLPTDRVRPPVLSHRGASASLRLEVPWTAVRSLARAHGATPFQVLTAAFQALLHRHAGQDDLVIGTPTAGRGRAAMASVAGYFVNPVPLRADLSDRPTFAELLGRARREVRSALARAGYPFPLLAEAVQPERDPARSPVFQAMLVLERPPAGAPAALSAFALGEPGGRLELGGLALESMALEERSSQLDLTLRLAEMEEGIAASLQYSSDLFDGVTARRLLERFGTLLAAAVADPSQGVAALPVLAPAEEMELRAWSGAGRAPEAPPATLHQLVAAQAERTPGTVAVRGGGKEVTYRELIERAGRLARHLVSLGAGPERVVGVLLDRTPDLVAALLGVLESGAAYLPLDPAYPVERLAFMREDAGVRLVVTPEMLRACREEEEKEEAEGGRREAAGPGNLAYLIYTSGSTGRPKAVAVEHRSAVARMQWAREAFSDGEMAAVLASTSVCFDLSVFEIFAPLSRGGTVVLAANALDLPAVAGPVTLVNTVPSAMAELADVLPASVRTVCLAGEPLPAVLAERLLRRPGLRLLNLYGPSEDTTYSTAAEIVAAGEPPIGAPLPGTRAHVVDAELRPVPPGVYGELLLGGAGLSRGYLGRPDLTAERFVPDPFGPPGGRLYRTGDRVRHRATDGALLFLGRLDRQVKIRGFRVEPGEVEAALGRHPAVRECAVLARPDGSGLVAYVSLRGGVAPEELRRFLAARLPAHLVPAGPMVLDALPQTPNGKMDRIALSRLAPEAGSAAPAAPRTALEEALAGLWREALGAPAGPRDDFFALGGHSLLAVRLLSRVREALGSAPPLAAFVAEPTLDGLTRALLAGSGPQGAPPAPVPRTGPLPLSFAQQRLWFLHRLEPGSAAYNVPLAARLTGALDVPALAAALAEVVRRHEVLRTRFVETGGEPAQVVVEEPVIPLPEVDREALLAEEAARPFDLAAEPPIRALLLRRGERERVLLLTLHHIVSDGWSLGVLARELGELYPALAAGRPSPLPPLPLQYGDFAVWQRERLRGEALASLLDWWRRRLAGVPPLDLPTDRPRPLVPASPGGQAAVALPLGDTAAFARRQGCTLYMVLLAAFQALLGRYADQTDFAVGSPVAGRGWRELEGLVGCFVGTLAMRADLAGDPTAAELARRARETALAAYAHEELPFEKLVEELAPERDLGRSPIFQAMLALQNAPLPEPALGEVGLEPLEVATGAAKFELTLSLRETADGLAGTLEYRADLFDRATAERAAGHFATLLAGLAADPERRWSDLPLLTSAELAQLADESEPAPAAEGLLHERFERQAAATPGAVAVTWRGESLTYGELAARSGRLAARLRELGVGPEARVGVYTRRTPAMVTAVLGVLRAGGAYVPLDPVQPAGRLAGLLADSGARVLVTQEELPDLAVGGVRVQLVETAETDGPGALAAAPLSPRNLSHVIYTSGSTGRPKGVAIEHRSGAALVRWALGAFAPDDLDAVLAATSLGFDLSVFELFAPLSRGGRVVLAENVLELPWLADASGVTLVNTVPSAMAELIRLGPLPASVRAVCLAGEALPRPLAEEIHARGPVAVWNLYGPTEDTTYSTAGVVSPGETGAPSIGRPVTGTRVRILDRSLRPVPAGVPGELCLAGAGLARGYLDRPDLTAGSFVPDPFAAVPGERLYRTGDRARRRPDGGLDYLGRIDRQVKVRGVRIEPGEIEAVLAGHPAVEQAAVTLREDRPGDRRLAAYVVLHGEATEEGLREHLRRHLPEPMVPAWIVPLAAFPRTASGKVDRRALPSPAVEAAPAGEPAAPSTPLEEELARIWAEVLGCERVGVHDDFFALGGHSLLAIRLIARMRDAFALEVPLQELFRTPTVSSLARLVEDRRGRQDQEPAGAPAVARADRNRFRATIRSRTR